MYIKTAHPAQVLPATQRPGGYARNRSGDKTFADIVEHALAVDSVDINGERRQQQEQPKREEKKKDEPAKELLNVTV